MCGSALVLVREVRPVAHCQGIGHVVGLASNAKGDLCQKAEKLVQWQNNVASGKAAPLFVRWTNDDEERLKGLMVKSIDINDTHYG
jgi:hypothetical protein